VNDERNTRKNIFKLKINPDDIIGLFWVICKRRLGTFSWPMTQITVLTTRCTWNAGST